jgi:hypothetical protein
MRPPQTGVFGGVQQMRPPQTGFFLGGGDRTGFWRPVFNLKKNWNYPHFFFRLLREKGMANEQVCPAPSEEVLDVENK